MKIILKIYPVNSISDIIIIEVRIVKKGALMVGNLTVSFAQVEYISNVIYELLTTTNIILSIIAVSLVALVIINIINLRRK